MVWGSWKMNKQPSLIRIGNKVIYPPINNNIYSDKTLKSILRIRGMIRGTGKAEQKHLKKNFTI